MTWRLGIDLGTNSLGWAALELGRSESAYAPIGVKDCGVRIFSDGRNAKDKQSNAVQRREPRGARKNRDRYKRRRTRLMRQLIEFGLMPADPAARKFLEGGKGVSQIDTDPWILRARALDEEITLHQLGRAIFHLHQRRGFKSNRKTDRADGNESGKVHDATKRTLERLKEKDAQTLGQLFGRPRLETYRRNQSATKGNRDAQPLARVRKSGEGAKWQYDYYPTRALILDELGKIWKAQKQYHPRALNDAAYERLRDTIESQHPLKSPPVGKCTLIPEKPRAAKALPSTQRARIFQEVNALKYGPTGQTKIVLSTRQRDLIAQKLLRPTSKTAKVTFDQIRRLPKLDIHDPFNTESKKRSFLKGDETAAQMMQKERWGTSWFELDLATQDEIVTQLIDEEDEDTLVAYLMQTHGLDNERAFNVADCPLVSGYGSLSKLALGKILPPLEAGVTVYSDAVKQAGLGSHTPHGTGEIFDEALPYYGRILDRSVAFGSGEPKHPDERRYGKLANPTVHVALNQIRAVINDLLKRFGPPAEIVIELARDLPLSAQGKKDLEKRQSDNQDANDQRRLRLADEFKGQRDNYENRMRLRLYEELEALGKCCIYTGEHIGAHNLFSDEVEIEHILPFSDTFDDSFSNKVLSLRRANRDKGNKTPHAAFSASPPGYDWEEIARRADALPASKRWRFGPDAMERYEQDGDFLARQLTDTQYISRLAKGYLEAIYGGQGYKGAKNNVWVIPGRLTSDLRWQWGLDSVLRGHNEEASEAQKKNRNDHRHHAIDAIVVACTDRGLLKKAADQAKQNEDAFSERLLAGIEKPWDNFRTDVETAVRAIIVSHKPDHGIEAAMHNDTAYGIPKGADGEPNKKGVRTVVLRKPLDSDSFKKSEDLEKIRDEIIRLELKEATFGLSGADFKQALKDAGSAMKPRVYKVRIEEKLNVIPMKNAAGKVYKAYKGDGNYCYDIWLNDKGKWTGEVISTYRAYQLARKNKKWWQNLVGRDGQKLLMRLRKNDFLQIDYDGRRLSVVVNQVTPGKVIMSEHLEANVDARTRKKNDGNDPLKYIIKSPGSLQQANAKRVTVSPSGVVKIYQ